MASVIFDFDGTIADSLPVILQLFYKWSKREPFSDEEIAALRDMPAREVINAVGVPIWRAPSLLVRGRKEFTKHIDEIDIFQGMQETIIALHSQGHALYLMSSNSQRNVSEYLKRHDLEKYFSAVYGSAGLFKKASAMKKIVKRHRLNKAETFSIGDETRDIDAAKKIGLQTIAVSWGFNSPKILKQHKPDFLITKPAELIKLIK